MPNKASRSSKFTGWLRLITGCVVVGMITSLMLASQCAPPPGSGVISGSPDSSNQAPTANAGEAQTVEPGSIVTLSGSASDPENDALTYSWTLTDESKQALADANLAEPTLSNPAVLQPTFTAPRPSTPLDLVYRLTVTDSRGATGTATTTVTVSDNTSPLARAGADQITQPGQTVRFDGSSSSDVETKLADLIFSWTQTSGDAVVLTNPAGQRPSFIAPVVAVPTVLEFELTVTDAKGGQGTDTVQARILPIDFAAAVSYPAGVGSTPTDIVTGNFNYDVRPDIAVADSANDQILVFINDGSGGFGAPVAYPLGGSPQGLITGDFDNDGSQDLAAATSGNNKLYVLLNSGNGTFTVQAQTYDLGPTPASLIAVDLDGRNGPDVATVNIGDDKLSVRLNDGEGTFNAGRVDLVANALDSGGNVIAATGIRGVAAGRIDSDSRIDLLAVYEGTDNAVVFLNQGDGNTFQFPGVFDVVSADPSAILLSDMNADNRPDAIFALRDVDTIAIRTNNGDGTFGLEARFNTGAGPSAVTVADIDNDGRPDLIVANETGNSVSILQNKGTASFRDKIDFALAGGDTGPAGVAAADLNGDGAVDIVTANATSGTISVLLSRTSPLFTPVDADGFTTTGSWLKYKDITVGTGDLVESDSTVVVRYTGRLNDEEGQIFDTTTDTADETTGREFNLGGLIKGWQEGIGNNGMRVGGIRQLIMPAELAYGTSGSGPNIPPNAQLWFEVEVIAIK